MACQLLLQGSYAPGCPFVGRSVPSPGRRLKWWTGPGVESDMDAHVLQMLIPIVAILSTFGFPVAIIFVFKWFKLKDRELQLDSELRKDASAALEARVQRLESILLQIEPHLVPPTDERQRLEEPAERAAELLPLLQKDRSG